MPARFPVIEFPSMDRILEWYDSPEYRQTQEIRGDKVPLDMLFAVRTAHSQARVVHSSAANLLRPCSPR